ncbi:hypothetical protein AX17_001023 [Amanita inopinata Kibby_2008]|nr:hypothetical protein AX17_001023 [Amanita inopinata Kibby_2008]
MVHTAITEFMPDFAGHVIDQGRLKLLESLGSGAYGKVYRAVDRTTPKVERKYYAVKCLCKPKPGSRQDEFQNREFFIHRLVGDHSNIVTLHKIVSDDFFVYVILDLYPGGDLFAAITEKQVFHMNDGLIKHTFVQLIDAVHYCHEKSVFHRDIKPENILVAEDGMKICLADFGLSTMNRVCRDFGCGSSYYMSPECIGKEISCSRYSARHSDIWSLGVILTNMISGRNPWRSATTNDDCFAAYLHDNDFLCRVLPISEGANNILKKIFNINPLCRISLPDLRSEILRLDTFFIDERPLVLQAEKHTQSYEPGVHNKTCATAYDGCSAEEPVGSASTDSDEQYAFRSPDVEDHVIPAAAHHVDLSRIVPRPNYVYGEPEVVPEVQPVPPHFRGNSSSTGSGQESEGPITPATKAIDPEIQVPDLQEEENSAIHACVDAGEEKGHGASKVLYKIRRPFAKHTQLLRFAVNKIVGGSSEEAAC